MRYKRGDIYYANLDKSIGSEEGGIRPVIIIQNDKGNFYSPTLIAIPLTSKLFKTKIPTHFEIIKNRINNLNENSIALVEQIITIDKKRIRSYIGRLEIKEMHKLEKMILISLGINKKELINLENKSFFKEELIAYIGVAEEFLKSSANTNISLREVIDYALVLTKIYTKNQVVIKYNKILEKRRMKYGRTNNIYGA